MSKFLFTVSLFIVTAFVISPLKAVSGYGYRVSSGIVITPVPGESSAPSDLGIVGDVRSCGGPGQVVQWRYEPCKGDSPCKIPGTGQRYRSELEFIPSENIAALGIRFNVITEHGAKTVLDRPIANSAVEGGRAYFSQSAGGPPKEAIGHKHTFQYILYQVDTGNVEICAEADFEVVEP